MSDIIRVVGISGSLRKGSFNTALLREAIALGPEGMIITEVSLADIPVFNQDDEPNGLPESIVKLVELLENCDAILISTPEYNNSIPGGLKNAIDWISRAPSHPLAGKPLAIMGASPGALGTAISQTHLRQVALSLDMHPVNRPGVFVGAAHTKFDSDGNLTDDRTRQVVSTLLKSLADWTRVLRNDATT